jgi:hypothetical protein
LLLPGGPNVLFLLSVAVESDYFYLIIKTKKTQSLELSSIYKVHQEELGWIVRISLPDNKLKSSDTCH